MGFIREQFGRFTIESRRESFMVHVEDADLREASPEWETVDLDDLIAALTDYRASLPGGPAVPDADKIPANDAALDKWIETGGEGEFPVPAASPDERLREAPDEAGRICCRVMGADGGCNICAAEATR